MLGSAPIVPYIPVADFLNPPTTQISQSTRQVHFQLLTSLSISFTIYVICVICGYE